MFKHKEPTPSQATSNQDKSEMSQHNSQPPVLGAPKEFTINQVGELLEKNLKWSQIIYEQNRKINRKLFVSSLIGWIYFVLIVAPIVLAAWFLPPILKDVYGQYQGLLGIGASVNKNQATPSSLDQLLKLLQLDSAKEQQLKTLLK